MEKYQQRDTTAAGKENGEADLRYGWLRWKPASLQRLNRAAWFTFLLCYANGVMCFMKDGLHGVVLSSIERRFGLSSAQSSFMTSTFDIASIPMVIVVSLVGAKGHRPLWIGWTMFLFSLASLLFMIPHFATGLYQPGGLAGNNLCRDRTNETVCSKGSSPSRDADFYWMFVISRVLMGIGSTPIYSMAITFLDDIVTREGFAIHIALFYAMGVFGPAVGYIGGGQILNLYTDFHAVDPKRYGLTPRDPRWVGAWWLGFLVGGLALFLVAPPLCGFARDIPGAKEIRAAKKSEHYGNTTDDRTEQDLGHFRDLPRSLKILFTNPCWVFSVLQSTVDGILIAGFTSFGPKYVENQFSMSAGYAGMLFGIITIPGGAGGTILGGYVVKWFKLTTRGLMRTIAFLNLIIIMFALMFFITCQETRFVGVNVGYENSTTVKNISAPCNAACSCQNLRFAPICSADNRRYFSPCHAGCTDVIDTGSRMNYYNCSCISATAPSSRESASSVNCTVASCKLAPLFLVLLFFAMFFTFMTSTLGVNNNMRIIPKAQKSLSIGVGWILGRTFGSVPGPLLFGAAFDASCTLWDSRCNRKGSCLAYDNNRLGLYMFLVSLGVKAVALIFINIAWIAYKPPPDVDTIAENDANSQKITFRNDSVINTYNGVLSTISSRRTEKAPSSDEPGIMLHTMRTINSE